MARQIPLRGRRGVGKFALVDDEDYQRFAGYSWHCTTGGYASGGPKAQRELGHHFMHRIVCCTPDGYHTDHINGDRLDNRKENLRPVTPTQNMMNTRVRKGERKTSKYKGVCWNDICKFWYATIGRDNETINLGNYSTQREAAMAYNQAAAQLFGEYAKLNEIPEDDPDDRPFLKIRPKRGGKSAYTGVTWHCGSWAAFIKRDGKGRRVLGCYPSEKLAALVYDAAAIERYGDEAIRHVNFPDLISCPLDLSVRFVFKAVSKSSAPFRGIGKIGNRWHVRSTVNNERDFKLFDTAEGAAEYYDKCVLRYDTHKSIYINFPEKLDQYLTEIGELPSPVRIPLAEWLE